MAKFCTKCGKELKDGKCSCEKNVKKEEVKTSSGNMVNDLLEMVKGIFKSPIDTIKGYASEDNFVTCLVALLANCLVTGLFLYFLLKESIGSLSMFMGGYASLLGNVEIPFVKVVLYGTIFMASYFATSALMIYVMANVIFKEDINIKTSFSLVGVTSVFTTITTAVSIILVYVSVKVMALVLVLAGIFYLTYLAQGIKEKTNIDANKLAYVFIPTIAIATFVMTYILPKILF